MAGIEIGYLLNRLGEFIEKKKIINEDEEILFIFDDKKEVSSVTEEIVTEYYARLVVFIGDKNKRDNGQILPEKIIYSKYYKIGKIEYKNKTYKHDIIMDFLNECFLCYTQVVKNIRLNTPYNNDVLVDEVIEQLGEGNGA